MPHTQINALSSLENTVFVGLKCVVVIRPSAYGREQSQSAVETGYFEL